MSDRIDISSSSETDEANAAAALDQLASVRDQGIVVLVRIRPTSKMEEGQRSFLRVQGPTQVISDTVALARNARSGIFVTVVNFVALVANLEIRLMNVGRRRTHNLYKHSLQR